VAAAEAEGLSRKDAVTRVAEETGARRKDVYSAAHS
jgi:16S rRNA (cytidine1402-2'-O)-methyltransferase